MKIINDMHYNNLIVQLDKLFKHNRKESYGTRARYYEAMDRFCKFLANEFRLEKLANIKPKHLFAYAENMQERGLRVSTIQTDLSGIRFWCDQMEMKNKMPENSEIKLKRRKYGKTDRAWAEEAVENMLSLCNESGREDYASIILLFRHTGMRIHEGLRVDTAIASAAIRNNAITIKGKNGKIRDIPLDDVSLACLSKMLKRTKRGDKLFVPDGVTTDKVKRQLEYFVSKHREEIQAQLDRKKPLTVHGLRHTYAVEKYLEFIAAGYSKGGAERKVSLLLGHNRRDVTRIYLAGLAEE